MQPEAGLQRVEAAPEGLGKAHEFKNFDNHFIDPNYAGCALVKRQASENVSGGFLLKGARIKCLKSLNLFLRFWL